MSDEPKEVKTEEEQHKSDKIWEGSSSKDISKYFASKILASYMVPSTSSLTSDLITLFSSTARAEKKSLEEEKHNLVKELLKSDIDPVSFDVLLSNEINRRLKVRFGIAFLLLTLIFTATSYAIVVFDGIFDWGISDIAITALIIETPIQFIGLLYIIARNLFPSGNEEAPPSKPKIKLSSGDGDT
jgi:hypothetical protein